jgi:plastocyanin
MFTEDGEYLIQCREYCGFSHYNMKAKLFVEPAVTPVAAETPPATTPITTPNATVVPNQQQQQQQQQQQPSANTTTSAAAGNATTTQASAGNATSAATAGGGGGGVTLTSPDYDPDELTVKKGDKITVNNVDTMPHTVTNGESGSDPNSGKLFDTSIINGGDSAEIDTSAVDAGAHPFYCMVHPYMTGSLTVE